MSTYNIQLQSNNAGLQEVLQILQNKAAGSGSGELVDYSENEDAIINKTITSYTNDRIIIVGSCAFNYCTSLTTVNFPVCISIGNRAFDYCTSLTTVNFPVCTHISSNAFDHCSSLTTVNSPACTYIGNYAFRHCSRLTTVSFPACTSISNEAFAYCYKLTTASFPTCTYIGNYTFINCSKLTIASFPTCTYIGNYTFSKCSNLSSLTLGASSVCTLSNSNAFLSTPFVGYSASFSGTPYIYVPASLIDAYKTATNWVYFSSYFSTIESLNPNLITFTIDETEYQAEEGMTWAEWVESEYNTGNYYISNDLVELAEEYDNGAIQFFTVAYDNFDVSAEATIVLNRNYYLSLGELWVPA